jgi:tetratricopeptide (TPR) repeat protein
MLRSGRRVLGILAAGAALVVAGSAMAHDASAVELTPVANTTAQSFTSIPVAQSAMDLMRAGRAADALALLEPAAAHLGKFAGSARAYCAHDGSMMRGARVLDADTCDALYLRAFALTELGRRADAVDALQQLTALSPDYPRYFVELAFAYRASGEKDKALATYSRAVAIATKPEMARYRAAALRGIGYMLVDKGDLGGAEKAYRASLQDDPNSQIAVNELKFIARKRADVEMKGG